MWYWCFGTCTSLRVKISHSCLCYNHWCHTVWRQTLERRSCCLLFFSSLPRQIFPSFVSIMLSEHVSEFPFFFIFLFEVPQPQCGDLTPTAYYGLFLFEQQALIWHAEPCFAPLRVLQVAEEVENTHTHTPHKQKTPQTPREGFFVGFFCLFFFAADMCWCLRACAVTLGETQPRTQIRRKTSEGKEEKATKAVSGNVAMKGPPRRNWFWQPAEKWASHTQMFTIHTHRTIINSNNNLLRQLGERLIEG